MDRRGSSIDRKYSTTSSYSSVPTNAGGSNNPNSVFDKISVLANTAKVFAEKGAKMTGNLISSTVLTTADAVGLKDKVEMAEKMARKVTNKASNDANKAARKARRLANKAVNFDEEDTSLDSSDYDLLLSAAGATEKQIAAYGNHSQTFVVPAGSAFVYKARVKKLDIGFSVREIKDNDGIPVIIEPLLVHSSEAQIQGKIPPSERQRNINLFFDNSHSPLQRKTVVFWVAIGEKVSLADDQIGAARSKEVTAAEEGPKFDE